MYKSQSKNYYLHMLNFRWYWEGIKIIFKKILGSSQYCHILIFYYLFICLVFKTPYLILITKYFLKLRPHCLGFSFACCYQIGRDFWVLNRFVFYSYHMWLDNNITCICLYIKKYWNPFKFGFSNTLRSGRESGRSCRFPST